MAINATKTSSIPPIVVASLIPSTVPLEIASSALDPILSIETLTSLFIDSVCGYKILAITIAPGAAMTEAANKCLANSKRITGSFPPKKPIYAARTPPATVAIPPIITSKISDLFIRSK